MSKGLREVSESYGYLGKNILERAKKVVWPEQSEWMEEGRRHLGVRSHKVCENFDLPE